MEKKHTEHYVPSVNSDGADVYCPFDSDIDDSTGAVDKSDDCIEKDVVERYSGNINILS